MHKRPVLIIALFQLFYLYTITYEKPRFDPRVTIVLLDSGINLADIDKRYLCQDHGINLTGKSIRSRLPSANKSFQLLQTILDPKTTCIYVIKTYHKTPFLNPEAYLLALLHLQKYQFETLLIPFEDISFWKEEVTLLERITSKASIYVSAGDSGKNLNEESCLVFPACLSIVIRNENFKVVGSKDQDLNTGKIVSLIEHSEFDGYRSNGISATYAAAKGVLK